MLLYRVLFLTYASFSRSFNPEYKYRQMKSMSQKISNIKVIVMTTLLHGMEHCAPEYYVFVPRFETKDGVFLLQRYSKEWCDFVDVLDIIEIDDGDHLKVVPLPVVNKSEVPT